MPRRVLPPGVLSKDGRKAFEATSQESDLACALILASYIDQCLASLLQAFLIESSITEKLLDPNGGLLGSFEARAQLAYTLALISKPEYQNLNRIAQIRNLFAHSHFDIKFEEAAVEKLCNDLILPPIQFHGTDTAQRAKAEESFRSTWLTTPRMKYVFNSILLANSIVLTAMGTTRRSRSEQTRTRPAI